jgi:dihydropteroate synthase
VRLRLRGAALDLEAGRPLLVGIVNASPDSFSDPGPRPLAELVERARRLVADGAAVVDVGGESGRTDREAVSEDEEVERVAPLVERLAAEGLTVSVDTWRAPVARAALQAGAAMINDVSGLSDPGVADACAATGAALVVTHTRARPKTKAFPAYDDVVADVLALWRERSARAARAGVGEEQLVLDPGIDLAKTPTDSIEVLRRLEEQLEPGRPLLLAISRKDFVGALTGRAPSERLAGTLAAAGFAAEHGAALLRVHDVAATRDYLRVRRALAGAEPVAADLRLAEGLRREPAAR